MRLQLQHKPQKIFLFDFLRGGETAGQWRQVAPASFIASVAVLLFSPTTTSSNLPAPLPATLDHPSSSINPSAGSMRQRITKSYQPEPCQISKHNHYVNPSLLLLLLHSEDGLSLWSAGREQNPSLSSNLLLRRAGGGGDGNRQYWRRLQSPGQWRRRC